nr:MULTISPECIES: 50S ribosomal protein L18 [unclassified Planococcus (in: firmicutes)]
MKGVTSVITKLDKNASRKKRHARVRSKITGTAERPRLNVFRSNKYIYAQLIDDVNGVTLASASSADKDFSLETKGNVEAAAQVGETIAKRAVENGLKSVVFDRGGYLYHGRVKALAESARENGLEF